jgi:hypothetical protein
MQTTRKSKLFHGSSKYLVMIEPLEWSCHNRAVRSQSGVPRVIEVPSGSSTVSGWSVFERILVALSTSRRNTRVGKRWVVSDERSEGQTASAK